MDPYARQLLDFVAGPESGGAGYNATWGNRADRDFSGMTLSQVIDDANARGRKYGSGATGRYQFMGYTLEDLRRKHGLTGQERFTPEFQDQLGVKLLQRRGFDDYRAGKISPTQFASNLAKEWAGLPAGPHGRSHYAGDGKNKSGVSWDAVQQAIAGSSPQQQQQHTVGQQAMTSQGGMQGQPMSGPMGLTQEQLLGLMQPAGGQEPTLGEYLFNAGLGLVSTPTGTGGTLQGIGRGIGAGMANMQANSPEGITGMELLKAQNELYELEDNRIKTRREQQNEARQQEYVKKLAQQLRDNGQDADADALLAGMGDRIISDALDQARVSPTAGALPEGAAGYKFDPDIQGAITQGMMEPKKGIEIMETRNRQLATDVAAHRKEFDIKAKPARQQLQMWQRVVDLGDPEEMTAADDVQLVKALAKMTLPDEAVMSGDTVVFEKADENYLNQLTQQYLTGGSMDPDKRRRLISRMRDMAERAHQNYVGIHTRYGELGANLGVDPEKLWTITEREVSPLPDVTFDRPLNNREQDVRERMMQMPLNGGGNAL